MSCNGSDTCEDAGQGSKMNLLIISWSVSLVTYSCCEQITHANLSNLNALSIRIDLNEDKLLLVHSSEKFEAPDNYGAIQINTNEDSSDSIEEYQSECHSFSAMAAGFFGVSQFLLSVAIFFICMFTVDITSMAASLSFTSFILLLISCGMLYCTGNRSCKLWPLQLGHLGLNGMQGLCLFSLGVLLANEIYPSQTIVLGCVNLGLNILIIILSCILSAKYHHGSKLFQRALRHKVDANVSTDLGSHYISPAVLRKALTSAFYSGKILQAIGVLQGLDAEIEPIEFRTVLLEIALARRFENQDIIRWCTWTAYGLEPHDMMKESYNNMRLQASKELIFMVKLFKVMRAGGLPLEIISHAVTLFLSSHPNMKPIKETDQ